MASQRGVLLFLLLGYITCVGCELLEGYWIDGPPIVSEKDLACGWPTTAEACDRSEAIVLSKGQVLVVDEFLDETHDKWVADVLPNEDRELSKDVLNTSAVEAQNLPSTLRASMDNLLRRIHGYAMRHIRISSNLPGPWTYKEAFFPDTWLFRRYFGGTLVPHLDTGNFGRCLSAVLHIGEKPIQGGLFRTRECRRGNCTAYGWQYAKSLPSVPIPNLHDSNLMTLAQVPYKRGRIAYFLSESLHDVTEHTYGNRDIIFTWFSCTPTLINGVIANGHMPLLEFLIAQRADVSARYGETVEGRPHLIHSAAQFGHVPLMKMLIDRRAELFAKDMLGSQAIKYAAQQGRAEALDWLIEHRASVSAKDGQMMQPIHHAAIQGNVAILEKLLDNGASPSAATATKARPVHYAAGGGHVGVLKLLRSRNASLVANSRNGLKPIQIAAQAGRLEALDWLIEHRASVDAKDSQLIQPIHHAALKGNVAILEKLLDKKASPSAATASKSRPVHYAASGGHVAALKLLRSHNANLAAKDGDGMKPIHIAESSSHSEVLRFLKENRNEL